MSEWVREVRERAEVVCLEIFLWLSAYPHVYILLRDNVLATHRGLAPGRCRLQSVIVQPGRRPAGEELESSPARAEGRGRGGRRAEESRGEQSRAVESRAEQTGRADGKGRAQWGEKPHCCLRKISILKIAYSLNLSTNYDILLYAEFSSHLQAEFTSDPDRRISPVVRISSRQINTGGESSVPCIRAPSIGPWKPSVRFGCRCRGVLWRCHPAPP